jgi:hypothetical protein
MQAEVIFWGDVSLRICRAQRRLRMMRYERRCLNSSRLVRGNSTPRTYTKGWNSTKVPMRWIFVRSKIFSEDWPGTVIFSAKSR